jgi:protein gp37
MPTGISYLDEVWNVTEGCSPISPACDHCYAARITQRFHPDSELVTNGVFNGNIILRADKLDQPLRWTKPRRIGVCFMSDLFHDGVKGLFVDSVADVALRCPQHTFFFLTKRSDRLWILPKATNIWAGVTVENSNHRYRLDELRRINAEHSWVSIEPMLSEIDLTPYLDFLEWVVFGGESGNGARKMETEWAYKLMDQCRYAGVPYFFKQWGSANTRVLISMRDQKLPENK